MIISLELLITLLTELIIHRAQAVNTPLKYVPIIDQTNPAIVIPFLDSLGPFIAKTIPIIPGTKPTHINRKENITDIIHNTRQVVLSPLLNEFG